MSWHLVRTGANIALAAVGVLVLLPRVGFAATCLIIVSAAFALGFVLAALHDLAGWWSRRPRPR